MASTNTLGKYEIQREIARSNDIVYEAVDPKLGRHLALKELNIPPNLTGAQKRERIERFLREGKAAGQLAHPNIVTIYDVGQEGDRFYIAMEYLEGQTLREKLQVGGALPVKDAIDITTQLCSALSYAHQHGVVHRDVKPENVQILPGGHVKLTDFGIARIMAEPSITANGQVFGTPSYMSPEQVSGKPIDGRSDIFSLGVMLYEMLAGQKPFTGDTVVTITYNIMNLEPTPPPGVPPYLIGIIRRAMAKDPNMRYNSADDMANDLKNPPPNGALYCDPFSPPASQAGYGPPQTTYSPPGGYAPAPPGAGTQPQHVPDPFAQFQPQTRQSSPMGPMGPPPLPRAPLFSAETKAFLGTLFLVVGLIGLAIFAVWVVDLTYVQYVERNAAEASQKYIDQGNKLLAEGKSDAAIGQFLSAIRAAGNGNAGARARNKLAKVYTDFAREAYLRADWSTVAVQGAHAVETDRTLSAGHYYLGVASLNLGDREKAAVELHKTLDTGGNDQFAIAARKMLSRVYIEQGDAYKIAGRTDDAKASYKAALDLHDSESESDAQSKLAELGG